MTHTPECFYANIDNPEKLTLNFFYQEWERIFKENLQSYNNLDSLELPLINSSIKETIVLIKS